MKKLKLLIVPSVPVWIENDLIILDRKFYDGINMYVKLWPGKIGCIMRLSHSQPPQFGLVYSKLHNLPFDCTIINKNDHLSTQHFDGASVVLASGDSEGNLKIFKLCKILGVKCVYNIEYTPKTRYQITSIDTKNIIVKLYRFLYIWNTERKRKTAFSHADGIQTNGIPAYDKYKSYENTLLYFDNRTSSNLTISDDVITNRLKYLSKNKSLRLAFSGQLNNIKGANHLITLALILKKKNIDFLLSLYGDGLLYEKIKEQICDYDLENEVFLYGSVDFYNVLLPNLKKNTDLFIMPHRQGDPSCTYIETLLCGLPIIGYLNEAFSSLLILADIGWGTEINDIAEIANIIEKLNTNRKEILTKSMNSINFSQKHDFESVFINRVNHLLKLVS